MASLDKRIERLEQVKAAQRCPHCESWDAVRVVYDGPEPPRDATPQPPEICPVCGWRPVTLRVVYDEPNEVAS